MRRRPEVVIQPAWYAVEERRKGCCRRFPARFCGAWVCFVLLLTFSFYMAHPALPSTTSRSIGAQAFASVTDTHANVAANPISDDAQQQHNSSNSGGTVAGPSYPLDVYAPQLPNAVPLTEVTVHACFPLWLKKCQPLTTPEKDARLGPWVLVDRPLDSDTAASNSRQDAHYGLPSLDFLGQLMASFETKYLFYRRSRRSDVPKVVDLRIVQLGRDQRPIGGDYAGWHRVKTDVRTTVLSGPGSSNMPVHLYYRTVGGSDQDRDGEEGMASTLSADEIKLNADPITELEVTYGTGPAWPGFEPIGVVVDRIEILKVAQVTMTARRTPTRFPLQPTQPLFKPDGSFKIMQFADLHFSVRHEVCRNVAWESSTKPCVADNDTVALMGRWLDEEKPDMVVFSGDQLNGQGTSWDEKSVIPKWVKPLIDRKILWASIQGNHDSQSGVLTRSEQQAVLSHLPYSLTRVGPSHLHDGNGAGNFYVKVRSPTPDGMHLFTLYFLDSGEHAPRDPWHPMTFAGYDWVRQDQIDWLLDVSMKVHGIGRPYTPDGGKDLGPIWKVRGTTQASQMTRQRRRANATTPAATYLSKPKALLFAHIPVPEAFDTPDINGSGELAQFGELRETNTVQGAQKKRGLFEAVRSRSNEDQDVVGLFHGHMHNNDGCRRVRGVWICFNGGSSYAGYGLKGFERRARVLHVSQWGQRVETWQRYESTPGRMEEHLLFQEVKPATA